jgi:hypothetical protein
LIGEVPCAIPCAPIASDKTAARPMYRIEPSLSFT